MDQLYEEESLRIYRYLGNEMSAQERSQFEKELENNKDLREALAFEQDLLRLGQTAGKKIELYYNDEKKNGEDKEVIATIKAARENWEKGVELPKEEAFDKTPGKVKRMVILRRLAIAAVTAGVIILGALWLLNREKNNSQVIVNNRKPDSANNIKNPDTSLQKDIPPDNIKRKEQDSSKAVDERKYRIEEIEQKALFAVNFKPDTALSNKPDTLHQALAYYSSGEYKDAIAAFQDVSMYIDQRDYEGDDKEVIAFYVHYYTGLSYMGINNTVKAIPGLKKAIDTSPDKFWESKVQWYLALAYLRSGNTKKTEELLKRLTNNDQAGEYKHKAAKLIHKLRKR